MQLGYHRKFKDLLLQFEIQSLRPHNSQGKSLVTPFPRGRARGPTAPWASQRPTGTQKQLERPGRRTMHGNEETSQLGQRLPVCTSEESRSQPWGSAPPSPNQAHFWHRRTRRSELRNVEQLHTYLPTYLPTYLLAYLKRNNAVPQSNALSNDLALHLRTKSQAHF